MMFRYAAGCCSAAIFVLSAQLANAQIAGQVAPLAPPAIAAFQADPGQLLSQFRDGGDGLMKQVSDLVSSDKTTLAAIIALAKNANQDQRRAIAKGLALAAKAYAANDPGYVNTIANSVANAGLPEFAKAYAEAAGDTGTASTGGGGGGGGPTANGPPGGGSNPGTTAEGNTGVANSSNFIIGGSPSGGGNSNNNGNNTIVTITTTTTGGGGTPTINQTSAN